MLKTLHRQLFVLLMAFDVILSAAVFLTLMHIPQISGMEHAFVQVDTSILAISAVALIAWPIAFQWMDLYESQRTIDVSQMLTRIAVSAVATSMILAATSFAFSAPVNPSFPFVCAAAQFVALAVSRVFLFMPLRAARRLGRNTRNVLIVGTGPRAASVKRTIESRPDWGYRVIGFVDDVDTAIDPSLYNAKLFKIDAMSDLLREQVVDRIIVAYPRSMMEKLSPVVEVCASAGVPITVPTDLFGDFLPPPKVTHFGTLASLDFAPVHHNSFDMSIKRGMDIVGAAIGIVLTAPILAISALAILLEGDGPILFRQVRCGLNGRTFKMLKLRTMSVDAEARKADLLELNEVEGPIFKCANDPRVTRVGRILRKLSLDELPQLWNVLRGDMSLVGPRPAVPQEVAEYRNFERRRLSMRPGITCIWQVSGRSKIGFERWVQLDVEYIDSWSLGMDLWILLKTIPAVLKGDGAH